jgi:hypothetical protein
LSSQLAPIRLNTTGFWYMQQIGPRMFNCYQYNHLTVDLNGYAHP